MGFCVPLIKLPNHHKTNKHKLASISSHVDGTDVDIYHAINKTFQDPQKNTHFNIHSIPSNFILFLFVSLLLFEIMFLLPPFRQPDVEKCKKRENV